MTFWTADNIKAAVGGTWLARSEKGASGPLDGISTDTRSIRPGQVFIALRGDRTDGHRYLAAAAKAGATLLIVDQRESVPATLDKSIAVLLVGDTGQALLKLGGAYRRTLETTKAIAVGGSNGKTTTVRLIHAALGGAMRGTASPKSFNNAVGVPLTLFEAKRTDQYLVCEVGTNAPGEIAPLTRAIEPDIAVITSIGREHLEGLGSLEGIVREEASLLAGLRPGGVAVVNADAPMLLETVRPLLAAGGRGLVTFGFADSADLRITRAEVQPEGVRFCVNDRDWFELPLLGLHNASNAAAAIAVARRLGVEQGVIETGLAAAAGPPMRLERTVVGRITFVNDAYNANPDSALAAIRAFGEVYAGENVSRAKRLVVVLGDMLELGASAPELHREIGRALAKAGWAELVLFVGPLSHDTADGFSEFGGDARVFHLEDAEPKNAAKAAALLRQGDAVLLKGSRRMGLERIIEASRGSAAQTEPRPAAKPTVAKSAS